MLEHRRDQSVLRPQVLHAYAFLKPTAHARTCVCELICTWPLVCQTCTFTFENRWEIAIHTSRWCPHSSHTWYFPILFTPSLCSCAGTFALKDIPAPLLSWLFIHRWHQLCLNESWLSALGSEHSEEAGSQHGEGSLPYVTCGLIGNRAFEACPDL